MNHGSTATVTHTVDLDLDKIRIDQRRRRWDVSARVVNAGRWKKVNTSPSGE